MTTPEPAAPTIPGGDRIGQVISGRYLIRELLGEGGMGSVYLAEHTHMKKRVALKLLHPEMSANAEVSARFEREAMAASHIEHPNVAAATDFGKTEDGAFFLVLEYLEGGNLRDTLAQGPITVSRALRITRQIALALERAHDAGIVHRDLKPENVMLVRRNDEPDFVKVLDFGIAKLLELGAASEGREAAAARSGQPLTRLGTILGTPEYMAPEQALGEPVTPAADLYGVGVMFYEMLTGLHPFAAPDRTAMLSFHIVAPVPPMRERAPEVAVPAVVEAIVRRLLDKDAKKRYPSARALIEAIDAAAAASPVDTGASARPEIRPEGSDWQKRDAFAKTSLGETASRPPAGVSALFERLSRQPRAVLYGVAAGAPLVLVLVVTLLVFALRGPKSAGNEAATADGGTGLLGLVAGVVHDSKTAPADRVKAAVALGSQGLEPLAKEFPADASLLTKLGLAYQAEGRAGDAVRAAKDALALDPAAAQDDDLVQLVSTIATKGKGDDDDDAFALLEGSLGERGVDALIELTAKGPGRGARDLRARATKSLAKPEVRAHATPAALVLLDLKAAQGCTAKRELLERVKDTGDLRILPALKSLKSGRGCGIFGRQDCYPCLRRDSALEETITAVEARPSPK